MRVTEVKAGSVIQGKGTDMFKKSIRIAMLLVIAVGGTGYFYIGQVERQKVADSELLKERAQKVSAALTYQVKKWQQSLVSLTKDPVLLASLKKDEQGLKRWISSHQSSIGDIFKLRVIRPGLMKIDEAVAPPISYASLDLIRRAESLAVIQMPEVHMIGKDAQHIAIAAPVLDNGKSLAVILISINVNVIQKVFISSLLMDEQDGFFALQQSDLKFASGGASSHRAGSEVGSVQVAGSQWQVVVKRKAQEKVLTQRDLAAYMLVALIAIYFLGFVAGVLADAKKRKKRSNVIKKRGAKKSKKIINDVDYGAMKEQAMQEEMKANIEGKLAENGVRTPKKNNVIEVEEMGRVPLSIFRAYDIRGIVDEALTVRGVLLIGRAIATEALGLGQKTIVIARDGRLHSKRLSEALAKGIQATGCDVVDIGQVPTPVLYFATHKLGTQSGVMVTGSHNPKDYNGLKIVIAGNTLSGDAILGLYKRIEKAEFSNGRGSYQEQMILPEYISAIKDDVRLGRIMKVVVDCGNGVAGDAAPMLLSALGCDVVPLYCEVDGNFPNHHPDPSKQENLQELIQKVQQEEADLGLAFDGDGDRLGVIDSNGKVIWPDRQMMLYAMDVLSRQAGADIVYDVKCTRNLAKVIVKHGGKPVMSKTGHSLIKTKMKETKAELGGEMSGHIFFKERWYGFDDALYTAARLLEILTAGFRSSAEIFAEFPDSVNTPELTCSLQEGENFTFVEQLKSTAKFEDAKIITIDGIRVEYKDGWGLVRASNTTPSLVLRFEADDDEALERIKNIFKEQMLKIKEDLELPF